MAIYRGPGGSGDATTDAANEASVASDKAAQAASSATAAAGSATSAATSATASSTSATASASSATTATTKASEASTSATNAATSATTATTQASTATTKAGEAAASATTATTKASEAATSATSAASSATTATTKASEASTSATSAAASYDSFDDRYLGAKSSAPTVDNDGNALLTGALYWNTSSDQLFVWDGSAWNQAAFSASGSVASFNTRTGAVTLTASDVNTALGSNAVLDSDIGSTVQAFSSVLAGTTASYTTAEKTKLSGIETAATADQTGAQIKTAYEAETNAFTDAQFTKLAGIEASATADQSAAEIKTAYESNADTNAFTDADHTKLDGIEASATADQTGAQIKTAYEAETNAFTDTQFTKLAGIEASADVTGTANVTAAGALMDSEVTNLAQVKAFDSSDYAAAGSVTGKNKIINGNFLINQRLVSGTVTLSAGAYGHDRFKAGSSGATYTFATSANVTTITITAGSLIQVVEGNNLQSGTHVLSWTGTAQGKIGGGSYAASGVTGTATGGTNLSIEFNTGTISKVQLEAGSTASAFEHRMFGTELQLCSRYFWRQYNAGQNVLYDRVYWNGSGNNALFNLPAPPGMRIVNATVTCSPTTNGTSVSFTHQQYGNIVVYRATAAGDNYFYAADISISAEL